MSIAESSVNFARSDINSCLHGELIRHGWMRSPIAEFPPVNTTSFPREVSAASGDIPGEAQVVLRGSFIGFRRGGENSCDQPNDATTGDNGD